ncbi:MAG TPA: hypothetical protein VG892_04200 [Terriglobales bacterium]|nr:hypothetical protein [Terriglobales bacterium]
MDAEALARIIEDFITESCGDSSHGGPSGMGAAGLLVMEDGAPAFDLAAARYSLSTEHGRCLLHMWSAERNTVRRVLTAERKRDLLKLSVQRFGRSQPVTLEICRGADHRTPTERKKARTSYERRLRQVLERNFAGFSIAKLTSSTDLARSFGPVYTRGLLRRGISALAVLGVNGQETQSAIDASLTSGILWLDHCRSLETRVYVEGLHLFVPKGTSSVVRERAAHMDPSLARWRVYELDETDGALQEIDCSDRGNIATRLVQCFDERMARGRFESSIARMRMLAPECQVAAISSAEISFRIFGLEFARARLAPEPGTFQHREAITFGVGAFETALTPETEGQFLSVVHRLMNSRRPDGNREDPLWRMAPERWMESLVERDVCAIDDRLDGNFAYSQVPAFSASDRAMIDILSVTRSGRLAIIELKANEDIQLAMQGLDYWARVTWHQQRGEFQRFGYFPGVELSDQKPLLLLVAPALQVHPAMDTLLRYISPEIEYEVIGIDERWREHLRVIFRRRREERSSASAANRG